MKSKKYIADFVLFIASMIWGLGYIFQKIGNEYKDVCFAKSSELREQINNAVLEAYGQLVTQAKEQKNNAGEAKKGQKKGRTGAERSRAEVEQAEADEDLQEGQDEQTEAGPVMSM